MSKKFNPKNYCGKDRIFQAVPGNNGIQRIWCWDKEKGQYRPPATGHTFAARRYDPTPHGGRTRIRRTFETIDDARAWQRKLTENDPVGKMGENVAVTVPSSPPPPTGPTFEEIYTAFERKKVSKLSYGTRHNYQKAVKQYFGTVFSVPIKSITPAFIDNLLDKWRESIGRTQQSRCRTSFSHELAVLRSVLKFYEEYYDDPDFRFPLKRRHAEDAIIRKSAPKHKDLSEEEFLLFRSALEQSRFGMVMAAMATVQYYQALRISEVAALRFEDIAMDFRSPENSRLSVCQHIIYPRTAKVKPMIEVGFKNAGGGVNSVKTQPMWPQTFEAMKQVFKVGAKGLVFGISMTTPFSYRQIQDAYDGAFEKVGLPYRGTHVLRHGGTRRVYNATGGDLAVAQQLLGNSDLESTLIYAQRDKTALRKLIQKDWEARQA